MSLRAIVLACPIWLGALAQSDGSEPLDLLATEAERLVTLAETVAKASWMERAPRIDYPDWSLWASSGARISRTGLEAGLPMDAGLRLGWGPGTLACFVSGLEIHALRATEGGDHPLGQGDGATLNLSLGLTLHDQQGTSNPAIRRQRRSIETLKALLSQQLAFEETLEYGLRNMRAIIDSSLSLKELSLQMEEAAYRLAVAKSDASPRLLEQLVAEHRSLEARYDNARYSHDVQGALIADGHVLLERLLTEALEEPWSRKDRLPERWLSRLSCFSEPSYMLKTELQWLEATEAQLVHGAQALPGVDVELRGGTSLQQGQAGTLSIQFNLRGALKPASSGSESRLTRIEQARAIALERRQGELAMTRGLMETRASLWALSARQLALARDDLLHGSASEPEARLALRRQLLTAERLYALAWLDALEAYLAYILLPD